MASHQMRPARSDFAMKCATNPGVIDRQPRVLSSRELRQCSSGSIVRVVAVRMRTVRPTRETLPADRLRVPSGDMVAGPARPTGVGVMHERISLIFSIAMSSSDVASAAIIVLV